MPNKEYTTKRLLEFWRGLNEALNDDLPRKLYYGIGRNIEKLEPVVQAYDKNVKEIGDAEGWSDIKKRVDKKHAIKKEDGTPLLINGIDGNYQIENRVAWIKDLEAAKAECGQDQKERELESILDSKEEFNFFLVDYKELPTKWTAGRLKPLLPMINEDSDISD